MRYCFHHIPKTGGSTLKARLNHRASIGQIDKFSYAIGHNISVSTIGKHSLLIEEIINSKGKNILDKIVPGDRFFTPNKNLEKSLSNKIIYTSSGKK